MKENSDLIVVFHQRWSLRILGTYFDNEEGFRETDDLEFSSYLEPVNIKTSSDKERLQYIKKALRSQINNIVNQGHKLVLVYPVPEVGTNTYRYLFRNYIFNNSIPVFQEVMMLIFLLSISLILGGVLLPGAPNPVYLN